MTKRASLMWSDRLYTQLFPLIVLTCAAVGVWAFAVDNASASLNCFISIFFGIRLDNHLALRRQAERAAAAEESWRRLTGPVPALKAPAF